VRTKWDIWRASCRGWSFGAIFNLRACWIGVHGSYSNKRVCFNLVPFVTFWIASPGGILP
jgi:hypothetical protein